MDLHPICKHWLATYEHPNVVLVDGCHDSPEGVVKAAKLIERIFDDERDEFVMVTVEPLPDLDPPINEEDADLLHDLMKRSR